ncbi:MAG: hypothetical protein EA385_01835 [Salinarimonadaceae bacterium]|nr:MAG: hypothetical protein EA385_01835 [Salinarimonadaceae bacterium]
MELRHYLDEKLRQAFSEEWDPKRPTRVEIVEDGELIGLRFLARRRDGSWSAVHEEPHFALASRQDVDDFLARALSVFLMKHPGWPR